MAARPIGLSGQEEDVSAEVANKVELEIQASLGIAHRVVNDADESSLVLPGNISFQSTLTQSTSASSQV